MRQDIRELKRTMSKPSKHEQWIPEHHRVWCEAKDAKFVLHDRYLRWNVGVSAVTNYSQEPYATDKEVEFAFYCRIEELARQGFVRWCLGRIELGAQDPIPGSSRCSASSDRECPRVYFGASQQSLGWERIPSSSIYRARIEAILQLYLLNDGSEESDNTTLQLHVRYGEFSFAPTREIALLGSDREQGTYDLAIPDPIPPRSIVGFQAQYLLNVIFDSTLNDWFTEDRFPVAQAPISGVVHTRRVPAQKGEITMEDLSISAGLLFATPCGEDFLAKLRSAKQRMRRAQ